MVGLNVTDRQKPFVIQRSRTGRVFRGVCNALACLLLASCNRLITDRIPEFFLYDAVNPPLYSISGVVHGLTMEGLVLSNNGDTIEIPPPGGAFVFPRRLRTDSPYNVVVARYPGDESGSQMCTVFGGSGIVGNGDISGITVGCGDAATVLVTIPAGGLEGNGLVLLNRGGDPLTINGPVTTSTEFAFHTPLVPASPEYDVTVGQQPANPHQTCSVTNGSGTWSGSYPGMIHGIEVSCVTNRYAVRVNVSGLLDGNTLVLSGEHPSYPAENGLEDYPATTAGTELLEVDQNGLSEPFSVKIRSGDMYSIAVHTQPAGQTCTVGAPTGEIGSMDVVVPVNCSTNSYFVQGTVTGLEGNNLRIVMSGGDSQMISVTGSTFTSEPVLYGTTYDLRILNPTNPWQTCSFVDEGDTSGTIESSGALDAMGQVWDDQIVGGAMHLSGDITGIAVECITNRFSVGGQITGYPADSYDEYLILELNGDPTSRIEVPAPDSGSDTDFMFPDPYTVESGRAYNVAVVTHPRKSSGEQLVCTVIGNGTMQDSDVTGISISCKPGGAITVHVTGFGTSPEGDFILDPDGDGPYPGQTVQGDGLYSFYIDYGSSYNFETPNPQNQSCTWSGNPDGTMGADNISLALDCSPIILSTSVNADSATLQFDTGTGPFTITFNKEIELPAFDDASTSCNDQAVQISMVDVGGSSVENVHNNFISCLPVSLRVNENVLTVTPNPDYIWYEATYMIRIPNSAITDVNGNNMAYATSEGCSPEGCYQSATGFNTGGLARRYDFNGGALTDLSRQSRDISSGSALPTTGVDGDASGAVELDGSGVLEAPVAGLPLGDSARTICAWVQISDWSEKILSYGDGLSLRLDNGMVMFGTEQSFLLSDFVMPYRSWLHLCGRYDGFVVSLYINGRFHGSALASLDTLPTQPLILGGDEAALSPMKGKIDGVRIYSAALPDRQIRYLSAQVPSGLVAHYSFDNVYATDDEWWDSSGMDQDLTAPAASPSPDVDRFKRTTSAYRFAKVNGQHVRAPDTEIHAIDEEMTVMAWVMPSLPMENDYTIVSTLDGSEGFSLQLRTVGPRFAVKLNRSDGYVYSQAFDLRENIPVHVAVTVNATETRFYVDGTELGTTGTRAPVSGGGPLYIGTQGGSLYMDGVIDDVRLYNRVLGVEEIRAMVQQPNKRIFVSSTTTTGNMGGVEGADQICNLDPARPDPGAVYRALIMVDQVREAGGFSSFSYFFDWVLRSNVTYMRDKDPIFTANWERMIPVDNMYAPFSDSPGEVWMGVVHLDDQWYAAPEQENCHNWTSETGSSVSWGRADAMGVTSIYNQGTPGNCSELRHLYCVEQ